MPEYQDFSGRDFTARFEAALALLSMLLPELTDRNHSDAGISLVRLLEDEIDKANFYLDRAFNEQFIPTAKWKQSLINIASSTDWPPKLASAASTTIKIARVDGFAAVLSIPKYSKFTRIDGMSYLSSFDVILPEGTAHVDVPVIQGIVQTLTLHPEDFVVRDLSKRPKYNLGKNIAARSVSVVNSDLGLSWTEVESFWRSLPTDRHFVLELQADKFNGVTDTVFLVFGDEVKGGGSPLQPVTVQFVVCDGAEGNCGAGKITEPPYGMQDQITCTNLTSATGGALAEDTKSYRRRIPLATRTQRRGVTIPDYQALIESIPGVAHCQAVDRNTDPYWPHWYVALYVVPAGGGPLSDLLKSQIHAQCAQWGHLGQWKERYILLDAQTVAVNVSCRIGFAEGYNSVAVIAAVTAAINALFDVSQIGIGDTLTFSDLHSAVSSVVGVSWVEFDAPTTDVSTSTGKILTLGSINITTQS